MEILQKMYCDLIEGQSCFFMPKSYNCSATKKITESAMTASEMDNFIRKFLFLRILYCLNKILTYSLQFDSVRQSQRNISSRTKFTTRGGT